MSFVLPWLRNWVSRRIGTRLDDTRLARLTDLLGHPPATKSPRAAERWWDEQVFSPAVWDTVLDATTNHESSFFREPPFFAFFETELRARRATGRLPVRVLSAGCAAGQEIFSCAISGRRCFGDACSESLSLYAVDVDRNVIRRAQCGRFRPWDLRGMTDTERESWFDEVESGEFLLREHVRSSVTFLCHNLLAPWDAQLHGSFDIVLLRNVIIHFSDDARQRALSSIRDLVRPGGVLAMASTEIANVPDFGFERDEHDGFFFLRRPTERSAVHTTTTTEADIGYASIPLRSPSAARTAGGALPVRRTIHNCFRRFSEGDFDGALNECRAVRQGTRVATTDEEGTAWIIEGLVHTARRELSLALKTLEHGACLCPLSWLAHFKQGEVLHLLERFDDAREAYRRALVCLDRCQGSFVDDWFLGDIPRGHMVSICRSRSIDTSNVTRH